VPSLGVVVPLGGVLSAVAPLALAAAVRTALVVDLDPRGPRYPGSGSLAELVADGPRATDLHPARPGVAVLRNGGTDVSPRHPVVAALRDGWPNVVLRLPDHPVAAEEPSDIGVVPVVQLLPGELARRWDRPAVYQEMGWRCPPPGPGVVLRTPARATVGALLAGELPWSRRWIRSWRQVWELPWV
jgi:hypothetical protein